MPHSSRATVRRLLRGHDRTPWRLHLWLRPKVPRAAACFAGVAARCLLLTRPLAPDGVVRSVDAKTSVQPRLRTAPTRPAQSTPPVPGAHEDRRDGARHRFAAFATRRGRAIGQRHRRKRAAGFLLFRAHLDGQDGPEITRIHPLLDNVATPKTQAVPAWLAAHPRFGVPFTPVPCSWLNPGEPWFGLLQRKRLRSASFAALGDLHLKRRRFITQWNERAHPFAGKQTSVAKVMAKAPQAALPELVADDPLPPAELAAE